MPTTTEVVAPGSRFGHQRASPMPRFLEARFEESSNRRNGGLFSPAESRLARRECDSSARQPLTDTSVSGYRTVTRLLQTVRVTTDADDKRTEVWVSSTASITGLRMPVSLPLFAHYCQHDGRRGALDLCYATDGSERAIRLPRRRAPKLFPKSHSKQNFHI